MSDTTIRLSEETRDRLMDRGKKGDTYDQIVTRLLDATENGNGTEAGD